MFDPAWRTQKTALMKGAPVEHIVARNFDLAILAPATLKSPLLAHQLLKDNRPFAMLLPSDLLEMVTRRADGGGQRGQKQTATRACDHPQGLWLLWIVHGVDAVSALCFGLEAHAADGAHSDWEGSSAAMCGATWARRHSPRHF